MYKKFDAHQPYFYGVAIAAILFGAAILSVGLAQWATNTWGNTAFFAPSLKVMGGAFITLLGYINLELELLRIKN